MMMDSLLEDIKQDLRILSNLKGAEQNAPEEKKEPYYQHQKFIMDLYRKDCKKLKDLDEGKKTSDEDRQQIEADAKAYDVANGQGEIDIDKIPF
jgi:hypothetical protein